jgi:hypothetical protein
MATFPSHNFNGSPIATCNTVNGTGMALAQIDCSAGVRAGVKCFNIGDDGVSALQYFTLKPSAAVVDHVTVEAALGFPTHRWILDVAAGTGTVASVGSADGSVVVTNPTTTPDLSVRVLSAATPAALAAINVATNPSTFKTGSMAFVTGTGLTYILQAAIGTADGVLLVATADDVTRQWIQIGLASKSLVSFETNDIDLTTPQIVQVITPMARSINFPTGLQGNFVITQKDGTVTTGPTLQVGSDAGISNLDASQLVATLATQAVNTRTTPTTVGPVPGNLDMTANGLRLQITIGSILGTATVHKARFYGCFISL